MDINQANDNELQKAIDDIAKTENPANAEGATSELEAKIQNQMGVPPVPPVPEAPAVTPAAPTLGADLNAAAPAAPAAEPVLPGANVPGAAEDAIEGTPAAAAAVPEPESAAPVVATPVAPETDVESVKTNMMRDLFPLMDQVDVDPERKWEIYKQMIDETGDTSMIGAAYEAVKGIEDEKIKAEALLYLINLA